MEFRKPGRAALYARFRIEETELDELRRLLEQEPKIERTWRVDLVDAVGTVHAAFTKTLHLRRRCAEADQPGAARAAAE
jgi:hypothetical protein